jgi:hypothetical protein
MLDDMSETMSVAQIARALAEDPAYRASLTKLLIARTVDEGTLNELIVYARSRNTTMGLAMVRRVLTDGGVSWEAV